MHDYDFDNDTESQHQSQRWRGNLEMEKVQPRLLQRSQSSTMVNCKSLTCRLARLGRIWSRTSKQAPQTQPPLSLSPPPARATTAVLSHLTMHADFPESFCPGESPPGKCTVGTDIMHMAAASCVTAATSCNLNHHASQCGMVRKAPHMIALVFVLSFVQRKAGRLTPFTVIA